MKRGLCLVLLLCPALAGFSQVAMMQVLASGGAYGETAGGYSLSSTISEYATETISGDVSTLTQGFQQPQKVEVIIIDALESLKPAAIQVFPNPATSLLNIQLHTAAPLQLRLTDNSGKEVYQEVISTFPFELDLSGFADGFYFLELEDQAGTHWVEKVVLSRH